MLIISIKYFCKLTERDKKQENLVYWQFGTVKTGSPSINLKVRNVPHYFSLLNTPIYTLGVN